jgi:hypothetical protein
MTSRIRAPWKLLAGVLAAAAVAALIGAAGPRDRSGSVVDGTPALEAAVQGARAGDVILLAPGVYANVSIHGLKTGGMVTIRSQDPRRPAVLTGFEISDSHGLSLTDLELVASVPGNSYNFRVANCADIHFARLKVHGSLDGDPQNDGEGLSILASSKVSVVDSEFQQLYRALGVGGGDEVEFAGNIFHDLRTTGIMIAATSHLRVLRNSFTDFYPVALDHPDAIQLLTNGTKAPAHDILIADNVIVRGHGAGFQGIFLRDQVGGLPFTNVIIRGNFLYGTGFNGIAVLGGRNLEISRNTLVSLAGPANLNWILTQDSEQVVSRDNEALKFGYDKTSHVTESGNRTNAAVAGGVDAADSVISRASYVMPAHVRRLWLAGTGLTGTANRSGGAVLTSLQGGNTLVGGAGGDVFRIFHSNDVIKVEPGVANETVRTSASYTLPPNVQTLIGEGADNLTLVGNDMDNVIAPGGKGGVLTGGAGDDTFVFAPGQGAQTVTDFDARGEHDRLDIEAYLKAGQQPAFATRGADAVVRFNSGETIVLKGAGRLGLRLAGHYIL